MPEPARAARLVSDVLGPRNVVVCGLLLIGGARGLAGLAWAVFAIATAAAIPAAVIGFGVRRGTISSKDVPLREHRLLPLGIAMASALAAAAIEGLFSAPWQVERSLIAIVVTLIPTIAVTARWKISVHTTVMCAAMVTFVYTIGPWFALATPAVLVVGWSRIKLGAHTQPQAIAGALVGAACTVAAFSV